MAESSDHTSVQIQCREPRITVLPNRRRFVASVDRILSLDAGGGGGFAVLHVVVRSFSGRGSVSLRVLNLVGNTLRAGLRGGEVAYLGEAEFAVFLPDVDAAQAGLYARDTAVAVANFSLRWDDEMLSVSASIGCVTGQGRQDGTALLYQAVRASQMAADKPGYAVQLVRAPGRPHPQTTGVRSSGAQPAFA